MFNRMINRLMLVATAVSFTSCLFEEDDIFDLSPAERMNALQEEYYQALSSAPNGWVMDYFPTREAEGFHFYLSFTPDDAVKVAASNKYLSGDTLSSEVSLYDVIAGNGPLLTFNTYNSVFHIFSDPKDPEGTPDLDGIGLEGDYEFVILDIDTDNGIARLKGKKRGTYINMRMLEDGQSFESYHMDLKKMQSEIFNSSSPVPLTFVEGDVVYDASKVVQENVLQMLEPGKPIGETRSFPFIITLDGLRFQHAYKIGNTEYQHFKPNTDYSKLISVESESVYFEAPKPLDFFLQSSTTWSVDIPTIKGDFKSAYVAMEEEFATAFKGKRDLLGIQFMIKDNQKSIEMIIRTENPSYSRITYPLTIDKGKGTFSMDASDISLDKNATLFYNKLETLKKWVALFGTSTFKLSSTNALLMENITLTSPSIQSNEMLLSR